MLEVPLYRIINEVLSVDAYLGPVLDFSRSIIKVTVTNPLSSGYSGEKSEFWQTAVFADGVREYVG